MKDFKLYQTPTEFDIFAAYYYCDPLTPEYVFGGVDGFIKD